MIYYVVFGAITILALVGVRKNYWKWTSIAIIAIVVLFAGLRAYNTWTDGELYYVLFEYPERLNKDFELGFVLWNRFSKALFHNYNIYLCITYLIVFILYYKEFKETIPQLVPFCLLVFYSTMIFSSGGMRQFIAGSITFYSIKYIKKKELRNFIICIIVAVFFHRSALIFIVSYWIDKFEIKFNTFIKVTPLYNFLENKITHKALFDV